MEKNNISRISIDLSKSEHLKLKSISALLGKSMRELIIKFIDDGLAQPDLEAEICKKSLHLPNRETQKSLDNIDKGKNLETTSTLESFFSKLRL